MLSTPRLPCNEECQTEERNRRLALALQIENPEAREKLGSNSLYSDFMKDEARKDPNLAKTVHAALTELVLKAKEVNSSGLHVLFLLFVLFTCLLLFILSRFSILITV